MTQGGKYYIILVGNKQEKVSFLCFHAFKHRIHLIFTEELGNGRPDALRSYAYPGQAFCPVCLYIFPQCIYFSSGKSAGAALGIYPAYTAASGNRVGKNLETAALCQVTYVSELHAKTSIRFIRAKAFHCFPVCHTAQGKGQFQPQCPVQHICQHSFV